MSSFYLIRRFGFLKCNSISLRLLVDSLRAFKGYKGISVLIILSKQQLTQMENVQMGCQCVDDVLGGRWPASFIHAWWRLIPILGWQGITRGSWKSTHFIIRLNKIRST